jgi:hypothetical protein
MPIRGTANEALSVRSPAEFEEPLKLRLRSGSLIFLNRRGRPFEAVLAAVARAEQIVYRLSQATRP